MKKHTCLIVGQEPDAHTIALHRELELRGARVLPFASHPTRENEGYLSFAFSPGEANLTVTRGDLSLLADEISSVFWRVKAPLFGLPSNDPAANDADFIFREWTRAISGLTKALPNAKWINPLEPHFAAGNKLTQLYTAVDVGFDVPATCVSNDACMVEKLFENGLVIYKTLSHPYYASDRLIFTTLVSRESFEARRETLRAAPCLFQNLVAKAYELRVTVVGQSVIAMRIDSQKHEDTKIDWRVGQLRRDLYDVVPLPQIICQRIFDLMSRLGLVYGALDFVVTPEGKYVFLEINPGGQWLWMEELIGTPITSEIAGYIATGQPTLFG